MVSECLAILTCQHVTRAFCRSTQLEEEAEQALRKRALDQLIAGGRVVRKPVAAEVAVEEDATRQRRRGPDASRLSFETHDRASEIGENE